MYCKRSPKLKTNHVSSIPPDRKIHAAEEGHAARHVRLNLLAQLLEILAEYRSQQQRTQDHLKESRRGWHVFGAERGSSDLCRLGQKPGYWLASRARAPCRKCCWPNREPTPPSAIATPNGLQR